MSLEVDTDQIIVVHRMGSIKTAKPRPIVVRCKYPLWENILNNRKVLKDIKNDLGDYYKVTQQLPEPILTQVMERHAKIAEVRRLNDTMDKGKKVKIEVINRTLFLNGKPQKKHVTPPTATEMFNIPLHIQVKLGALQFKQSSTLQEKGSYFTGYAIKTQNVTGAQCL